MIILNEREYAEKWLSSERIEEQPYLVLGILAKYFYAQGHKKKQISSMLFDFFCSHFTVTKKLQWEETCDQLAAKADKYPLYEFDGVSITRSELEKIATADGDKERRLLFTMLCLAKLGNLKRPKNNGWVNTDTKELFKMARINCRVYQRFYMIGKLGRQGFLEFPKKNGNLANRVTFIDDESEMVLLVSDFRDLGYEYMKYCGENIIRCRECGILTRGNKNGTKQYCSKCAGYTPMGAKPVTCIDCGKVFEVDANNHRTNRCDDCYKVYRNNAAKNRMRRSRECSQNH